jgi:hypothetical protein
MKEFKSHIVICNWNQRAEEIIRQLFESHVDKSVLIALAVKHLENVERFAADWLSVRVKSLTNTV